VSSRNILAVSGSLRGASFNTHLLAAAVECAPAGMHVRLYRELGSVPLYNEELEVSTSGGPESVRRLREQVAAADGILIATPEYNQSLPGVLKNAIDWLSRPGPDQVLIGKPIAIIGASGGRWGTRLAQAALRQVLTATEAVVMPQPALFVREAANIFDDAGRLSDPATREQLGRVLNAFGRWIEQTVSQSMSA
jgi:chromate reductase